MSAVASAAPSRSEPLIQLALLGEAVEHMPIAVFVFDEDGHYAAVNGHACAILGYEREELLARRAGELAADPRTAVLAYRAVAEGHADGAETRVLRKDGTELTLRFRGARTTINGLTYYVGVAWEA